MSALRALLVHGAGAGPAAWSAVAPRLEAAGLAVTIAALGSQSLHDDAAAVTALLDADERPTLLVGHSYGGAVITAAGVHERVRGLVYVAAFALDAGESVDDIGARHGVAEVYRPGGDPSDAAWRQHSWDVPEAARAAAAAERVAPAEAAFTGRTPVAAWRIRPSWYLVASRDRHILPAAQRAMAARAGASVEEAPTSHSVPHAAPDAVAALVLRARDALAG